MFLAGEIENLTIEAAEHAEKDWKGWNNGILERWAK
jgi:hypothetical protein